MDEQNTHSGDESSAPPGGAARSPHEAVRERLLVGVPHEAEKLHREILARDKTDAEATLELATIHLGNCAVNKAIDLLGREPFANGPFPRLREQLIHALERAGRMDEARAAAESALESFPDDPGLNTRYLRLLLYDTDWDGTTYRSRAEAFGARFPAPSDFLPVTPKPPPLRVGFLSAHFEAHPISLFFIPVLGSFGRSTIQPLCYHAGMASDAYTQTVERLADGWRDVANLGDTELLARIRADKLHLLVDLDGHVPDNRLSVLASRAAPVQASWIGFPGTTGLRTMDYLLAGRHELPPDADAHYVEKLARLPHGFAPYELQADLPAVNALPALETRRVSFGCLNNLSKICGKTARLWAEILNRVEGSRLLVKSPVLSEKSMRRDFLTFMKSHGVSPDRLVLAGVTARHEHLKAYNLVDLALDPLAFSGSTTTCEALSMGVPVITLPGAGYHQRHAGSFLHAAGMPGFIASTKEEYVRKAVEAAGNLPALSDLRKTMRSRLAASPLCDTRGFTRLLERVLYQMAGAPFPG